MEGDLSTSGRSRIIPNERKCLGEFVRWVGIGNRGVRREYYGVNLRELRGVSLILPCKYLDRRRAVRKSTSLE
jgi:hypothetical protein